MRLLIFGSLGQVGRELVHSHPGKKTTLLLSGRAECDITDAHQVSQRILTARPDVIVNAAAYTKVDLAEANIGEAFKVNGEGARVIADAAHRAGVPLVHLSTDYVFNGDKDSPYVEADPVCPINVYGESKLAGEEGVRSAIAEHIIIRTSWVYGCHGHNFLKTMLSLAKLRDSFRVVADQFGRPTASADLAGALLDASFRAAERTAVWGTYHFAGLGRASWYEFACGIFTAAEELGARKIFVHPITTAEYPTAARRPTNSELNSDLFAKTFGTEAKSWKDRVRDAVQATLMQA